MKNKEKLILYIKVEVNLWKWERIKFYDDFHWNKAYPVTQTENLVLIRSWKTLNICFLHRSKLELEYFFLSIAFFAGCNLKIISDHIVKNVLSCTCVQAQSIKSSSVKLKSWIQLKFWASIEISIMQVSIEVSTETVYRTFHLQFNFQLKLSIEASSFN
jgi:hypothetical protein